jgi:hypothetical protein
VWRKERRDQRPIVIDEQELEEARRDPRVRQFLADADAYVKKLRREGRIYE